MAKRVTIEMVAREAGVSRGTVDRVINQRPHVSEDQYTRVMEAIRRLGYEPKVKQAAALGIDIKQEKVYRLGIVLPARNPWFLSEIERGIRDAQAQLADYSVEILTEQCSASTYPEEAVGKIDALLEKGAVGIVMSVMDCEPVARKIDELSRYNIPVATFDTDIPSSRLFYLGKSIERNGRVAGALMARYVEPGSRILIGMGNREIDKHVVQVDAFMKAMKEHGFREESFEIVETYGDYMLTFKKMSKVLMNQEQGPVRGVYMETHSLTGCMDAIRSAGLSQHPMVIFGDMNERVRRYLESGELTFCVTPNAYMMGYQPLLLLKEYLLDQKKPVEDVLYTPTEILCRENVI